MTPSVAIFTGVLVAGFFDSVSADSFLKQTITVADVEEALQSELGLSSDPRLTGIEKELSPVFVALPKNQHGRLQPAAVRYALHRYFMQKHGWYINGLADAGDKWEASSPTVMMADRAPVFIQSLFEKRLQGKGLDLHDLTAFAATLGDLIRKEAIGDLEVVHVALGLSLDMPLTVQQELAARTLYLAKYLNGTSLTTREQLKANENEWTLGYPAWEETKFWSDDVIAAKTFFDIHRNPFVEKKPVNFDSSVARIEEMTHQFGAFQNLECRRLKEILVEMEIDGTGRVPLSQFYSGYWTEAGTTFTESVEYLDQVGALDHTDTKKSRVVISNYMTSLAVCMGGSSFYHVCCMNECDGLIGSVENNIMAPRASPARVVQVVSGLSSDTVHAPRNLSTGLVNLLDEIAQMNQGEIPLHGRMFEQWMHHAFPRECPFPHTAGTKTQMSLNQWESIMGRSADATHEDMLELHVGQKYEVIEQDIYLPWDKVEDLLAKDEISSRRSGGSVLRTIAGMALIASFAVPLVRGWKAVESVAAGKDLGKSHLV